MWTFALTAGLAAAVVDVATMIPLPFPGKKERVQAMSAAFIERGFLGFVIGPAAAGLGVNGLALGVALGVGFSIPTSIITRTWAPIIAMGAITGLGVGLAYELVF